MKYISLILALVLLAASFFIISPELFSGIYGQEQVNDILESVTSEVNVTESISFENFPLCSRVKQVCEAYVPVINGDIYNVPSLKNELSKAFSGEGLIDTVYSFFIVALLSIPIYMLLRLIPFNSLYSFADEAPFIAKPLTRGLAACTCSIVSVTMTWFMYHSLLYEKVIKAAIEWISNLSQPEIALNVTNILIIIVGAIAIIGLLKLTLFRGSFINSILMAVLRTVLFTVIIAMCKTFIACDTLNVMLIGIALVYIVGIADYIIEPASKKR